MEDASRPARPMTSGFPRCEVNPFSPLGCDPWSLRSDEIYLLDLVVRLLPRVAREARRCYETMGREVVAAAGRTKAWCRVARSDGAAILATPRRAQRLNVFSAFLSDWTLPRQTEPGRAIDLTIDYDVAAGCIIPNGE